MTAAGGAPVYMARRPSRPDMVAGHGLQLKVHAWGPVDGLPVVLLHGWADCALSYQFIADNFDEQCLLVAFDWRGFGDSEWAAGGYWFPDYLADLDAVLRSVAPARDVVLVGHSMGGNVAGLYAGIRPERVKKLVLIEGFGLSPVDAAEAPGRYRRWLDQLHSQAGPRTYATLDELADRVQSRAPFIDTAGARFVAGQWSKLTDCGVYELKMDPTHRRINPVLYRRAEARACWAATSAPVLAVIGADSDLKGSRHFPELCADLETSYRQCRITEIGRAGHMLHLDQPAAVAALIREFIAELDV